MIPFEYFLILSVVLFVLGLVAFFIKRDLISMLLAIEVMLNAANLAFLAFARSVGSLDGQVVVFFIITVAAAEAALGLAIIRHMFKQKKTADSEDAALMKG